MIKQTYPKYAKNSDLSRGCTDTAARVRNSSTGDGGVTPDHHSNQYGKYDDTNTLGDIVGSGNYPKPVRRK
jgi:hypothetical protein